MQPAFYGMHSMLIRSGGMRESDRTAAVYDGSHRLVAARQFRCHRDMHPHISRVPHKRAQLIRVGIFKQLRRMRAALFGREISPLIVYTVKAESMYIIGRFEPLLERSRCKRRYHGSRSRLRICTAQTGKLLSARAAEIAAASAVSMNVDHRGNYPRTADILRRSRTLLGERAELGYHTVFHGYTARDVALAVGIVYTRSAEHIAIIFGHIAIASECMHGCMPRR